MSDQLSQKDVNNQNRPDSFIAWLVSWSGFSGKTLWDLLQLLIVPVLLAGLVFWFNNQTSIREQERSTNLSQEEALQNYLNVFEGLLLQHHLRTSEPDDEVRSVARARTLTVLRELDASRKGALLQFLYESRLIDKDNVVVSLIGADLSRANLNAADLRGADLVNANLREVDLRFANLEGADLSGADLGDADLWDADLSYINLSDTNLRDADLMDAYMRDADLNGANLFNTDLRRANLEGANVTPEQLAKALSLEGTIMVDGAMYDGLFDK